MIKNNNWLTKPTKKILIICVTIWLLSALLLIASLTNFFTESWSSMKGPMMGLVLGSAATIAKLYGNYRKNSKGTDTVESEKIT